MDYATIIWHRPEDKMSPTVQQQNKFTNYNRTTSNHEDDDGMLSHDIDGCIPERNKSPSSRPLPP